MRTLKSIDSYKIKKTRESDTFYHAYLVTYNEAPYQTRFIFGVRTQETYIFRNPQYTKRSVHNMLTFTARYCDCNGFVFSMRQDVSQPRVRHTCKHIDLALEYVCAHLRKTRELTQEERQELDKMDNDLRRATQLYLDAVYRQEEWPHKATLSENLIKERNNLEQLQRWCMLRLESAPHLYAHAIECPRPQEARYPNIFAIK